MSEFASSTPQFDKAISECNDPSQIREIVRDYFERDGAAPDPLAAPVMPGARPTAEPACFRVLYPHGNDRYEIYGVSEEELDRKEKHLRAMYGGQR